MSKLTIDAALSADSDLTPEQRELLLSIVDGFSERWLDRHELADAERAGAVTLDDPVAYRAWIEAKRPIVEGARS